MSNWTPDEYALPLCQATNLPMSVEIEGQPPHEILQVSYAGIPITSVSGNLKPHDLVRSIPPILLADTPERIQRLQLLHHIDHHLGCFHDALRESPAFAEQLGPASLTTLQETRRQCAALLLSETLPPLLHEQIKRFSALL